MPPSSQPSPNRGRDDNRNPLPSTIALLLAASGLLGLLAYVWQKRKLVIKAWDAGWSVAPAECLSEFFFS